MEPEELLVDGPPGAARTLVLAHGAGGPMDSPFMETVAKGIAAAGVRLVRFEFPYMRARRSGGRRGAPDREPVLRQSWKEALALCAGEKRPAPLFIGGKSLGGRIASLIADEAGVAGLVCLGYPFHPPEQPEKLRTAHLETLKTPTLILQGTRDPFGSPEEVAGYRLSSCIEIVWLVDGDHSFRPRPSSGRTEAQNLKEAVTKTMEFLGKRFSWN